MNLDNLFPAIDVDALVGLPDEPDKRLPTKRRAGFTKSHGKKRNLIRKRMERVSRRMNRGK